MLEAVSARGPVVTPWRAMLAGLEREPFTAPLLERLKATLEGPGGRASEEVARLERIVGYTDARLNEVFRFVIGPLLMWDAHCALALLRWRDARAPVCAPGSTRLPRPRRLPAWPRSPSSTPVYAWPELAAEPVLEARSLGHPLIPADRRVDNDVRLASAGRALVITGSNMSGKSTLLRALGANVVLAAAGAPACAASLRVGPLRVATSMRISDSLEAGVSHFYAELQRLKGVIDAGREPGSPPVLFLLDEILARDELAGAHHRCLRGRSRSCSPSAPWARSRRTTSASPRSSESSPGAWKTRTSRSKSRRHDDVRLRPSVGDRAELERAAPYEGRWNPRTGCQRMSVMDFGSEVFRLIRYERARATHSRASSWPP